MALFTSATPETLYAILALCRIGAVANMISPLFQKEQIIDRINEAESKVLVALDALYVKISDIISETCVEKVIIIPVTNSMPVMVGKIASLKMHYAISYSENVITWNEFIKTGKALKGQADASYEKGRAVIMVYSSGTTGASKGIVLTNDGLNATISFYLNPNFSYQRNWKMLQMIPIWFSTGIVLSIIMPLFLGVQVILEPVFSNENFAKNIKRYQPNMTVVATSMWQSVVENKRMKHVDFSGMEYPITGGEPMLSKTEERLNRFLKDHGCLYKILKGYGMCELGSTVTADNRIASRAESVGIPLPIVTVAAFNPDTNEELTYGERGEIRVFSPAHMKEYYKNPDATKEFFYIDKEGRYWGRTGDLGYVDEDGFIYILGRMNDFYISRKGQKVYCFDIENEIIKFDFVVQCEVVGIEKDGYELPVAHLILEPNVQESAQMIINQIHKNLKDKLSEVMIPCGYRIWDIFPVKNNGKRDMDIIKGSKEKLLVPENDKMY